MTLSRKIFFIALSIIAIIRIALAIYMPVAFDEAFMYLFSIKPGFYHALTEYVVPNNHILYSVIASLLPDIGSLQPFIIRIPAVLASIFSFYLFYKLISKYTPNRFALIISSLVFLSFSNTLYGYQARGYSFILLFAIMAIYATVKLIDDDHRYGKWYTLSIVCGMATMPSYLYFLFAFYPSLFAYLILSKKVASFKVFIKPTLNAILLTLVFYTPVLLHSGLDAIINNQYVQSPNGGVTVELWLNHWNHVLDFYWISGITIPILLLLSLAAAIIQKAKTAYWVLWIFLLITLFIPIIHNKIPFPRTWIYLEPIVILIVLFPLRNAFNKRFVFWGSTLLPIIYGIFSISHIFELESGSFAMRRLYKTMIKHDFHSVYINADLLSTPLRFYFETHSPEYSFIKKLDNNSKINLTDLDSLQRQFDVILLNHRKYENIDMNKLGDTCAFYYYYPVEVSSSQ